MYIFNFDLVFFSRSIHCQSSTPLTPNLIFTVFNWEKLYIYFDVLLFLIWLDRVIISYRYARALLVCNFAIFLLGHDLFLFFSMEDMIELVLNNIYSFTTLHFSLSFLPFFYHLKPSNRTYSRFSEKKRQ